MVSFSNNNRKITDFLESAQTPQLHESVMAEITQLALYEPDFSKVIQKSLDILNDHLQACRGYVFEFHNCHTGELLCTQIFESCAADIEPQFDNEALINSPVFPAFQRWYDVLGSGQFICGLVQNMPPEEQELLNPQSILSMLVVPILNKDTLIGFMGFDDTKTTREWKKAQIATIMCASSILSILLHRRTQEYTFQEQLDYTQDLFQNMADGVVYHDAKGNIYRFNPAACSILGLSEDQLLGRTSMDPRWKAIKADFSPYEGQDHPAMVALRTGEPVLGKIMGIYHPATDSYKWISINATPQFRRNSTTPYRVFAIFRDVTDQFKLFESLRISEERFTSFLNHLNVGVWIRNENNQLLLINDAVGNIFGIDKLTLFENEGERYMEFVHPDDRAFVRMRHLEHLEHKLPVTLEGRIIRADQSLRWVRVNLMYIQVPGKLTKRVSTGVVTDITDEKNKYDALRIAKSKSDELSALKSNIISSISHEFRTPITGIMGFANLLRDQLEDPELIDFVDRIDSSANRLFKTLESILNYAIIEAETQDIRLGEFDLTMAIQPKIDEIRTLCRDKGIYLQTRFPEGATIYSDRNMIIAIISELLDNAFKFTHEGGIRFDFSMSNDRISFEVHDTGIGIKTPSKAFVFEPFRQVSEGLARMYEGTGMGLAVLAKRVSLLGGSVKCINNEHGGASFYVTVPVNDFNLKDAINSNTPKSVQDLKVIYVEDNPVLQFMMKKMLREYSLYVTNDAQEALTQATDETYHVFLLDINLNSSMNGIELCRLIRKIPRYRNALILAITAYPYSDLADHINLDMFNHYVGKPFTEAQLIRIINSHYGI